MGAWKLKELTPVPSWNSHLLLRILVRSVLIVVAIELCFFCLILVASLQTFPLFPLELAVFAIWEFTSGKGSPSVCFGSKEYLDLGTERKTKGQPL